jgi:hypothetical protein
VKKNLGPRSHASPTPRIEKGCIGQGRWKGVECRQREDAVRISDRPLEADRAADVVDDEVAAADPQLVDRRARPCGETSPAVIEVLGPGRKSEAGQIEGDPRETARGQLRDHPAVEVAADRYSVHQYDGIPVALREDETAHALGHEASAGCLVAGDRLRNVLLHADRLSWIVPPRCYAEAVL